jgi:pimeloyl-ACP methyl ester carboxylesterase
MLMVTRTLFAAVGAAAVVVVCATSLKANAQQAIQWGACPPVQEGFPDIGEQECANVRVPLNYRQPNGRTINVAVSRIKAAVPAKRRGVLLLNIGGPGGAGLDMPRLALALYPQSVLDAYDLIGFDPRGVGRSAPVTCGLTAEQSLQAIPTLEQNQGFDATATFARDVADACAALSGPVLPFMTTANTARDMEQIRVALSESKISYLGYSYGSYLGAVYASLFPGRTDRWVLDSVTNPGWVWREQFRSWGPGADARFADFIEFAIENEETFHFGDTPAEVRALYFDLLAKADVNPIEFDGFPVNGPFFRVLNFSFLGNDATLAEIARLWQAVRDGVSTAAPVSSATAAAAGFPEIPPDNVEMSAGAVLCDDVAWSRNVERYRRELAADTQNFPLFGPLGSHIWPCAFWPNSPAEPPVTLSANGPANGILLINNLRDPATPLPGAHRMRAVLGARAKLVLVDQGGHAIFGFADNVCAADTVANYLASGVLPSSDTTCPTNPAGATTQARDPARSNVIRSAMRRVMPVH